MRILITALLALPAFGAAAGGGEQPVNKWVKLPVREEPGYMWARSVYVPTRGQILHWGCINTVKAPDRNDVRAFDAARGDWVSDYPPAAKLPARPTIHGESKGVGYRGVGEMLDCGTPAPSLMVDGASWDSMRKQLVYTMRGLMAAYDPEKKTWRDMKARTLIGDQETPGGPPVYGVGTGYDPVNDEMILFPHFGAVNRDMVPVTGRVSGHLGTLRYGFEDNTWKRVGDTFGTDQVRNLRKMLVAAAGSCSSVLDEVYVLRRRPDPKRRAALDEKLADMNMRLVPSGPFPGKFKQPASKVSERVAAGDLTGALAAGAELLRSLEAELEGPALRVEPPARCGTPLVYDPGNKCLVMFGGHDGLVRTDLQQMGRSPTPPGLNDTWVYDVTSRQWRELDCRTRPPLTRLPRTFYDPASRLVLLVRRARTGKDTRMQIWALDVAKSEWTLRHEETWGGKAAYWWTAELDRKTETIILTQVDVQTWENCIKGQETWAFRLDVGKLTPTPAPAHEPAPGVIPHAAPEDDPAWTAKLKGLPANSWVHVKPERDADTRDWGNAACDALRGHLYYFGGGHSTYQVNDVAVFNPGAGKWSFAAGDHNDWTPPVGWGGCCMGLRGGANAHHMRNSYVAVDGRMYKSTGASSRRWGAESAKLPGPRYCHFYDVDRGGVWRQQEVKVERAEGVPATWGSTHMATPDGRVIGFGGTLEPYDGRFFANETYFNSLDIYSGKLTIVKVPPPHPGHVYEVRPFCFLPDKGESGRVFFYEYVGKKDKTERQGTWVYDVKANAFSKLSPRRQPPGEPGTVLYLQGQDAVYAVINRKDQWAYSFEKADWAPLETTSDAQIGFSGPYTQMVYSAKYGVLVNTGNASRGVAVMRPDAGKAKWE